MDRAAVVTGSEGGIGKAICRELNREGFIVVGLDRSVRQGAADVTLDIELERFCESAGYRKAQLERIHGALGGHALSALVNNAAHQVVRATERLTARDWESTLRVNVLAPFLLTQALLEDLERAKGAVVNIASIHAQLTKPEFVCYATSKTALVGLTRSLAIDLGGRIRVNAVCPAAVATTMLREGFVGGEDELDALSGMHPIGRIAEPCEIAKAVVFLISPESNYITGTALGIDGGIAGRLHDSV
jgi:NAD(P)-dependent dehydrogenase (short-subunit alcohol dehydrogenase family)